MLKPRSPVLGYNHNVQYRGRVFHVQTEDSGPVNPRIFTHLYFGGTILASKRHEYDAAAAPEVVRALMQSQHKSILKDLKNGRHDAQLGKFFESRGEKLDAAGSAAPRGVQHVADVLAAEKTPPPIAVPTAPAPVAAAATPAAPARARFSESFEDEPTNPDEPRLPLPVAAPPAIVEGPRLSARPAVPAGATPPPISRSTPAPRSTPALGSPVVASRIIPLGSTPTPTPVAVQRARRPAPSIPYVVQEGSHPVAPRTPEPAPPVPLAPAPVTLETAPMTAAQVGATPNQPATREDSQSLDEVIMAYLSRG